MASKQIRLQKIVNRIAAADDGDRFTLFRRAVLRLGFQKGIVAGTIFGSLMLLPLEIFIATMPASLASFTTRWKGMLQRGLAVIGLSAAAGSAIGAAIGQFTRKVQIENDLLTEPEFVTLLDEPQVPWSQRVQPNPAADPADGLSRSS